MRRPPHARVLGSLCALLLTSAAVQAQPCGTPGKDGAGTITGIVNSYYPGTVTVAAGSTAIPVGARSGSAVNIGAGDLLLVIQMQDAAIDSDDDGGYGDGVAGDPATGSTSLANSGIHEFVVATGPVAGGLVPFLGGGNGGVLLNTYTNAAATAARGQRRYQVIRVPQYSSATLSNGLTALAWNGSVGGVLAIDVSGALALGGVTVSLDSLGFRGGGGRALAGNGTANTYRALSTGNAHGSKAEGIAGTPRYVYSGTALVDTGVEGYPNGSYGKGAPGNAGGGGTDSAGGNDENSGGGGGGNGGAGGRGGNTWNTNLARGGFGGAAFASAAARLALGGGGGAGVSNNAGPAHGARGGGLIHLRFNTHSGTGTLDVDGGNAGASSQDGAGGGGAGGSVFAARCTAGALTNLTVNARGGTGGSITWNNDDHHGPGGGGGGGVVRLSGAAAVAVTGGANGTSPASGTDIAYGSTAGAAGTSSTAATVASTPGARPGCICAVTQALVTSLRAVPEGRGLAVEWETSSEAATAGFYLFRFDPKGGEWLKVNEGILPVAVESPQGGTYQFLDTTADPRESHTYSLLEIESTGRERAYGPFAVTPDFTVELRPLPEAVEGYARSPRQAEPPVPAIPREADKAAVKPTALKIGVRERGLYRLTVADLAVGLGVDKSVAEDWIRRGRISLTNRGLNVPWQPAADASALRFFGDAVDSNYTAENIYWLTPDKLGPLMRTASGGRPAAAPGPQAFPETRHFEQDRFAGIAIAPDPESDYWFWEPLIAGDPTFGLRSFNLDVRGVAPGQEGASLTLQLQGATTSEVSGEHRVSVSLNGTALGDAVWEGVRAHRATLPVPAALLRDGDNTVELTCSQGGDAPYSITYVDSLDLAYPRLAVADGGSPLFVRGLSGGTLTVSGFASPEIRVYDVTQPILPIAVEGTTVDASSGGWRVSFAPAAAGRAYLVLDASGIRVPRVEPWVEPAFRLRSTTAGADHLILAPAALAGTAEALALHRRGQGLDSKVVTLEQIYDEFGDGLSTPWAIQRFLTFAGRSWSRRPTAAVLAGAGTYDYKDHLGLGGNLVPPLMVRTAEGLFASDSRLAEGSGLVVGRLPAASAAELEATIAKLIAYESSGAAAWKREVVLLADDADDGGQFDWESDRVAARVPKPYNATRLYLGPLAAADIRQQLLDRLGSGAFLLNYLGHAGLDRLAAEALLANADAAALANGDRLPLVAAMACIVGRFEIPGFTSLAETLLNNPQGGAAGVWAPAGLAYNAQSATLDHALIAQLFETRAATLGDAIRGAVERFRSEGGTASTVLTYNLFGDPATRLQRGE